MQGSPTPARVFDPAHRALTVGVVLGVTLFAFEGLAVVTVAPRAAEALSGLDLYGWIFSGYLLASLLGTVAGGWLADRRGPGAPFLGGLLLFALGLALAGSSGSMPGLIAGRVLQGLGGGSLVTTLYVVVTLAYPDALRPRMMAMMSTAWVLPALIGPAAAGAAADLASWRWVFWGMLPILALAGVLTLPAFRRVDDGAADGPAEAVDGSDLRRLLAAGRLVLGAGLLLGGLGATGRPLPALVAVAAGAALTVPALGRLLPAGTLRLGRGLPALIAARGLFFAAFVGVEAFLALMLTRVHGYSTALTGLAIATGSISWTLGSWLQERLDRRGSSRQQRVRTGTAVLAAGLALQLAALYAPAWPLAVTLLGWALAGLGIGLAHATSSVLALAAADDGEADVGQVSSALQLADTFGAALSTGVGGALFAFLTGLAFDDRSGVLAAFGFNLVLAALAVTAAARLRRRV